MLRLQSLALFLTLLAGDSFTIGFTALNGIKRWPWMCEKSEEIKQEPLLAIHDQTGKRKLGPMEFRELMPKDATVTSVHRHSRSRFHAMLLEQLSRIGLDVEYGREAVDFFEDIERGSAGIKFKDGSSAFGDLVVAADGVRTASWSIVAGRPVPARSSGNAMYRVAYPVELAMNDLEVAERFRLNDDGRPVAEMWLG